MHDSRMNTKALVFTDIVNSTGLSEEYGAVYRDALNAHHRILRDTLLRWNGSEIKPIGDGFFVVFDEPADAIQWTVEAQRELTRFSWHPAIPLQVRIGMHYGEAYPVVHPSGQQDYEGSAVNMAARVCGMADGGQIVVSSTVHEFARHKLPPSFTWHNRGIGILRGIGARQMWQVCHPDLAPPAAGLPVEAFPIHNLPFLPNPHFVGRGDIMQAIHAQLQVPVPPPVALAGMSGIGKTQIALEYAYACREEYPGGVFWLNAHDEQRLLEDFAVIGHRFFGLPKSEDLSQSAEQVHEALHRIEQPALLIFDNVPDDFDLTLLPAGGRLHILLTTQCKVLPENIHMVEPKPLEIAVALTLLQTHRPADSPQEKAAARSIVETVGCLPLALSLSAHHIRALGCTFADYHERLKENPHKPLRKAAERFHAATGHDGGLYLTLHRFCDGLNTAAENIMAAATCFAAHDVSAQLLFAASGVTTQERFDEALTELWSRNLITYETGEERRLTVHELVSAYFRENLFNPRLKKVTRQAVHALTEQMALLNERMDWSAARIEIEHCRFAARLCRKQKYIPGFEHLLYQVGTHLLQNRNLQAAQAHYTEGLQIARTRYGEESLLCALFLRELGVVAQDLNAPTRALKQVRCALTIAKKRLAPEVPKLAEYYNSLGYVLKKQNSLPRALCFYRRALQIHEQAQGENHPDVAVCLNNIGALLEEQQDYDGALIYLFRALAIGEAASDANRVLAAQRLNNIGRVYGRRANWQAALDFHQRAYDIYAEICDAVHPDLGACFYYLAEARRGMEHRSEAEHLYRQSLEIYEKTFGIESSACRLVTRRFETFLADS